MPPLILPRAQTEVIDEPGVSFQSFESPVLNSLSKVVVNETKVVDPDVVKVAVEFTVVTSWDMSEGGLTSAVELASMHWKVAGFVVPVCRY